MKIACVNITLGAYRNSRNGEEIALVPFNILVCLQVIVGTLLGGKQQYPVQCV